MVIWELFIDTAWLRNPDLWVGRKAYVMNESIFINLSRLQSSHSPDSSQVKAYNVLQRESLLGIHLLLFTLHLSVPSCPLATKFTGWPACYKPRRSNPEGCLLPPGTIRLRIPGYEIPP